MFRRSSARRSTRKVRRYARRARRTRVRRVARKSVARTARQTVMRLVETQDADTRTSLNRAVGCLNSTQWVLGVQQFPLTPNTGGNGGIDIFQGASEGARKGNKIRTVSASISFTAMPAPYNATVNPTPKPLFLKWWVVSGKSGVPLNTVGDITGITADMFDNGSGTVGTSRNTTDLMRPINTDKYTVHKAGMRKLFWSSYEGTGNATLNAGMGGNNDFKLSAMVKINATKYCPKVITYVDNSSLPTSRAVWLVFATYWADGTAMDTLHAPCLLNIVQDFKFKDF